MNKKKFFIDFKSLRAKLVLIILLSVILSAGVLCVVSYNIVTASTNDALKNGLNETAQQASAVVAKELEIKKVAAASIGCLARLANPDTSTGEKAALCSERVQMYNAYDMFIADLDGNARSHLTGTVMNVSGYDFFKKAALGESVVSEPMTMEGMEETFINAAAPLHKGGIFGGIPIGVVFLTYKSSDFFSFIPSITIGTTGYANVVDSTGTIIASKSEDYVKNKLNYIDEAVTDKSLQSLADFTSEMIQGKTGFARYKLNGQERFSSYAPIAGSTWSISISGVTSEFATVIQQGFMILGFYLAAILAFGILSAIFTSRRIAKPIKVSIDRLLLLAKGDLHSPVAKPHKGDATETALLLKSLNSTTVRLNKIVTELSGNLTAMSAGDLTLELEHDYIGDFAPLSSSLRAFVTSLNADMLLLSQSSEQVNLGAHHVAAGAQALSSGTTEQASSIQELSATIADISTQIAKTAQNAITANNATEESAKILLTGNAEMDKMLVAMDNINAASLEISNIIKTINDIAFQTNILALNAAVEAARAGEAGKGFAVVADEVRSLAGKSAEAAKDTNELISSAISAVEDGTKIANVTSKTLTSVAEQSRMSMQLVEQIAEASRQQSESVSQVRIGMDQISIVVQSNSATAEQSAAASEELSGQAEMLKDMVKKFKTKESKLNPLYDAPENKKYDDVVADISSAVVYSTGSSGGESAQSSGSFGSEDDTVTYSMEPDAQYQNVSPDDNVY